MFLPNQDNWKFCSRWTWVMFWGLMFLHHLHYFEKNGDPWNCYTLEKENKRVSVNDTRIQAAVVKVCLFESTFNGNVLDNTLGRKRMSRNTADRRYISVRSSTFLLVISSFAYPTFKQRILRMRNQSNWTINQLNWPAINYIDLRTVAASSSTGTYRRQTNVGLVSAP